MSVKIGGVRLKIGFAAAAFLALMLNNGPLRPVALSGAAVLLHELTHLFFMRRCGCRNFTVAVLPGGVAIRSEEFVALSYRRACLCLISAPALNLLLGGAFLLAAPPDAGPARLFGAANLALGAVNCLPLSFLDGGRTLECLLLAFLETGTAEKIRQRTDAACLLLLTAAAAVLTVKKVYPLPYYAFCGYCLLTAAFRRSAARK